jgi:hypothetical protein
LEAPCCFCTCTMYSKVEFWNPSNRFRNHLYRQETELSGASRTSNLMFAAPGPVHPKTHLHYVCTAPSQVSGVWSRWPTSRDENPRYLSTTATALSDAAFNSRSLYSSKCSVLRILGRTFISQLPTAGHTTARPATSALYTKYGAVRCPTDHTLQSATLPATLACCMQHAAAKPRPRKPARCRQHRSALPTWSNHTQTSLDSRMPCYNDRTVGSLDYFWVREKRFAWN